MARRARAAAVAEEAESVPVAAMEQAEPPPETADLDGPKAPTLGETADEERAAAKFANATTVIPAVPMPPERLGKPDAESFFEPAYTPVLAAMIVRLVEEEGSHSRK